MDSSLAVRPYRSIRVRMFVFSVLVTLLPTFGMGWFWFDLTRKATSEKFEQKLLDSAGYAEREITIWLKERSFELRTFAGSSLIRDYVNRNRQEDSPGPRKEEPKSPATFVRISNYLSLIRDQYRDYRALMLLDTSGRATASSSGERTDKPVAIPENWKKQFEHQHVFASDVYVPAGEQEFALLVGVPLFSEQNSQHIGFLVVEILSKNISQVLRTCLPESESSKNSYAIDLLSGNGQPIASTLFIAHGQSRTIPENDKQRLFSHPRVLQEYYAGSNERILGIVMPFSELPWRIVASGQYDSMYSGLIAARDRILLITLLLTIVIGGLAAIVATQIITPLKALTRGVLNVAQGDLDASVPVHSSDELGIVADSFNSMVRRLKEDQLKLELLAITDSLTGLANRKQIMLNLHQQIEHFKRYSSESSVLMLDIDHFKMINDTHGHLVGDTVLVQLAQIFQETLRSLDSAGRYGGEEFLVILGQTNLGQAMQIAERLRQKVERHLFTSDEIRLHVTVSLGVTEIKEVDLSPSEIIHKADTALYEAKHQGRNKVVAG